MRLPAFCRTAASITFHPSDTTPVQVRKSLFFAVLVVTMIVCAFMAVMEAPVVPASLPFHIAHLATMASFLIYMVVTKRCGTSFVELAVGAVVLVVFSEDFRTTGSVELWSYSIVGLDLMLLCTCRKRAVNSLFAATVLYIIFRSIEESFELGIYSSMGELSLMGRMEERKGAARGVYSLVNRLIVVGLDFFMTRRFCYAMLADQKRMEATIVATEEIAEAFVRFDLDAAEEALEGVPDGPLHVAFSLLLTNLRMYRPYIPEAVFALRKTCGETSPTGSVCTSVPPQGPSVAIAFTDIEKSCSLWGAAPGAMHKAMVIHNRVMRWCIDSARGYEVKTIGDAFMVAFDTALDACRFCLSAQHELYQSEWPADLTQLPQCAPAEGAWNGLRVRMGVHFGEVEMVINPVTGRADYYGQNVNIAARIEGAAEGGTVAVTDAVLAEVGDIAVLGKVARDEKVQMLKGIAGQHTITLLVPEELSQRLYAPRFVPPTPPSMLVNLSESNRTTLKRVAATVGWVRVNYDELGKHRKPLTDAAHELVEGVLEVCDRTEGKVSTVCNTFILVTWNVLNGCTSRSMQAVRFASLLKERSTQLSIAKHVTVGLSAGEAVHGPVGNVKQRFVLTVGRCFELCEWLAAAAADFSTFVLAAAPPDQVGFADDVVLARALRKVDQWKTLGGEIEVYDVALDRIGSKWEVYDATLPSWTDTYHNAFAAGDLPVLHSLAVDDPVVARVVYFLERPSASRGHWLTSQTSTFLEPFQDNN